MFFVLSTHYQRLITTKLATDTTTTTDTTFSSSITSPKLETTTQIPINFTNFSLNVNTTFDFMITSTFISGTKHYDDSLTSLDNHIHITNEIPLNNTKIFQQLINETNATLLVMETKFPDLNFTILDRKENKTKLTNSSENKLVIGFIDSPFDINNGSQSIGLSNLIFIFFYSILFSSFISLILYFYFLLYLFISKKKHLNQ